MLLAVGARAQLPHTIDRPGEPEVYQREYMVSYHYDHAFIQTFGVSTCVALILYQPESKKGLVAHIDAPTDIQRELQRFGKEFDWTKVEVSVLGGLPHDPTRLYAKVLAQVKALGGKLIREAQNTPPSMSMNLRLNLATGEVSTYLEGHSTTPPHIAQEKIDRIRSGTRLYRHQDSAGGGDPVGQEADDFSY